MTHRTLFQFLLDSSNTGSPETTTWFLDSATGSSLTRSQIETRVACLALGAERHFGLLPSAKHGQDLGPIVSIVSPNDLDFGPVTWACHSLGYMVAPSNSQSTADELVYQFRLVQAQCIFAHPDTLSRVLAAAETCGIPLERVIVISRGEVRHQGLLTVESLVDSGRTALEKGLLSSQRYCDAAFLCFSSGTTGLSKAVLVPHSSVIANLEQILQTAVPCCYSQPGDRSLGIIPFSHMYGLLTLLHLCSLLGITTVVFKTMPSFDPFLQTIVRLQINHLFLVPPLVNAFLKHPATSSYNLKPIFKTALIAAAPLDAHTEQQFRSIGGPNFMVSQVLGLTETSGLVTALKSGRSPIPGSVAQLLPDTHVKIITTTGDEARTGELGELRVKGPQLSSGYLNNPEATKSAFDEDGYFITGDLVETTEDGTFVVRDRLKQLIKVKGFQVSPAELEGHLLNHPFVSDVGVIGKRDERSGEVPVAFVVLTEKGRKELQTAGVDIIKEIVQQHVKSAKSPYKWLADVLFIDAIPKVPSGKILKRELQKMLSEYPIEAPSVNHAVSQERHLSAALPNPHTIPRPIAITYPSDYSIKTSSTGSTRKLSEQQLPFLALQKPGLDASFKRADPAPSWSERISECITLYHIFHAIALLVNCIGVGLALSHHWDDGRRHAATIALANILAALLSRNEIFLRFLHAAVLFTFARWPPLFLRHSLASILLNVGGFHSGCAAGGLLWIITANVEIFRAPAGTYHCTSLVFGVIACVALFVTAACAIPQLRTSHHNIFENMHRLVGWSGLAILWVLIIVTHGWSAPEQQFRLSQLIHNPDLWLALVITFVVYFPWTTLRKVPCRSEVLSRSVLIVRFQGGYGPGLFGRVSRHPLKENHAFGITSYGSHSKEHYMVIVGQGDFTRGLIDRPPTYLWTRSFKFVGLPYCTNLYRSGLFIVTGSAIGVGLSIFLQRNPKSSWHLLWISANIEGTYGKTVLKDLRVAYGGDEELMKKNVTIWDSRIHGRPDLGELIQVKVDELKPEAVFVTSNPKGTADALRACRRRGIWAHGPIWDS